MSKFFKLPKNIENEKYNIQYAQNGYGKLYYENKILRRELLNYKLLARRIERQIEELKKARLQLKFIDGTNCEYYRRISDSLEMLERIYYNYDIDNDFISKEKIKKVLKEVSDGTFDAKIILEKLLNESEVK